MSLRLEPQKDRPFTCGPSSFAEGRIAEAKEALRQALRLSIDNVYAAHELLDLSNSLVERREALDLIREELSGK